MISPFPVFKASFRRDEKPSMSPNVVRTTLKEKERPKTVAKAKFLEGLSR